MAEAATLATDAGLVPAGEGWFVVNLLAAAWERKGEFGVRCRVEAPDARFPGFGIAMHVLDPGQPNGSITPKRRRRASSYSPESAGRSSRVGSRNCASGTISTPRPTRHTSSSEPVRNRASSSWSVRRGRRRSTRWTTPRTRSLPASEHPPPVPRARHARRMQTARSTARRSPRPGLCA